MIAFDSMNILSRLLAIIVLLGSLAYGSYAVGRYVLSEKLFGASVDVQPTSGIVSEGKTRVTKNNKAAIQSGKPDIEVTVLPASQAGPGPDISSITELQSKKISISSEPMSKQKLVNPNTLAASRARLRYKRFRGGAITGENGVESDDDSRSSRRSRRLRGNDDNDRREEERPRRRRRKRKRRSETTSVVSDSGSSSSTRSRRRRSESNSESSSSDNSSSSRRSRSSSDDAPARSQSSSSDSSSSSGDSPVPQSF